MFTTSGTYPWSFVTQIFHNGQPSRGGDRKAFEVMTSTHQLVDIDQDLYLRPGDGRTRDQHRFFQERSNYDTLRNSFQRTAREWNHLPDTTVGASSIEEFRANLQQQVEAGQIGPNGQSQIGPIFVVYYCQHAKLNSLNTIQQNI